MNGTYVVSEWDGSLEVVNVHQDIDDFMSQEVLVEYLDGVCHRVSEQYLIEGLGAVPFTLH